MAIHRNYSREILYLQMPDRFRAAKFFKINILNFFNALSIDLCSAANGMQINTAVLFAII